MLAANATFYEAIESADLDTMLDLARRRGHGVRASGQLPVHGRGRLGRSWALVMASTTYIQFFLTDVAVAVHGDTAWISVTENVLTGDDRTGPDTFGGGRAVATNVFARTPDGWRLCAHHSSPVLSAHDDHDDWRLPPTGRSRSPRPPWDRLAVTGISVVGHHGVLPDERRDGQLFLADLVLHLDTTTAASSDDLHDTVDYGTLVDRVAAAMASDPVDLIETLAQRLADICLQDGPGRASRGDGAQAGRPDRRDLRDVHLTITRSRSRRGPRPEAEHP